MSSIELSNGLYNALKKLVQVILPAASALYFGLAAIWDLPAAEQVVGTIAVVTTFLGVSLGISSNQYHNSDRPYDGTVVVIPGEEEGVKRYSLELDTDLDQALASGKLTFKTSVDE